MGIAGKDMQRCLEYTVRYGLGTARAPSDKTPTELFEAIAHVARHQVADILSGTGANRRNPGRAPGELQYWIDKVCTTLNVDAWLDDSLDKWFLDTHHPLADIIVQACRRKAMEQIASCVANGFSLDHDDLVLAIVHELQAKFPSFARFNRHLPAAVESTIENDVLGVPLVDRAEPANIMSGTARAAPGATTSRSLAESSYTSGYPNTSNI
jgi:hypothetical protein